MPLYRVSKSASSISCSETLDFSQEWLHFYPMKKIAVAFFREIRYDKYILSRVSRPSAGEEYKNFYEVRKEREP